MLNSMPWPVTTHDLAPGDEKSAMLNLARFDLARIRSIADPLFEDAYGRLWQEFGPKDEMEQRDVLDRRFQLEQRFYYEMALVRADGSFVAVRDHTAAMARDSMSVVVHLSHNLVAPQARRTGIAGWMRALPIDAARQCIAANNAPLLFFTPITLLAEMEYPQPDDPARMIRLQAYERAGFRKIDPEMVKYFQPDFRAPAIIDAAGGARPLPFQLLVRRVNREHERAISGTELRQLVETLYDTYRPQFRAADLAHPSLSLDCYPAADAMIPLVPPTQC
jgi:GNAT superfamily N-acetyltransferase